MTYREFDNMINKLNKRLTSVSASLGRQSALYGHYSAIVASTIRKYGLLKVEPSGFGAETSIRRTKDIMKMTPEQQADLEKALKHIEDLMNKRSLRDEKKRLKKLLENAGAPKEEVKSPDYKKADEMARELSTNVNNAINYFYNYAPDSDNSPEIPEVCQVLHKNKKTFSDMQKIVDLAKKHYQRTLKDFPELEGALRTDVT